MVSSLKVTSLAVLTAAGIAFVASPVRAQVESAAFTKDEFKCESSTGKVLGKFVGAKSKCISKCIATQRKVSGPYTACIDHSDPAVNTCINDSLKGAEAKAAAGIIKACTKDCPECYADNSPNTCTTGEPLVGTTETNIDIFVPGIYCTENNGGTPTKEEGKCEDATSKNLVKYVGAVTKCYDKCHGAEFKGTIPVGSCNPPATDAATQTCINLATTKANAGIDKACSGAGANPACYVPFNDTGAEWTALTLAAVNGVNPSVACGSPSGAFLN